MVPEALHASDELARHRVEADLFDVRSVRPLSEATLLVADTSWELCGIASEIRTLAAEKALSELKAPVLRIALANCPAPIFRKLEQHSTRRRR
jgi:acetoin:2,6-dichlorophenolindophenol oxidoreductase subunit beta